MGKMIDFQRTTGGSARGYLAEAADAKAPGVVVIQEWWGVQGQIKATCDQLAKDGFAALAPDLYDGKVVPYHDSAAAGAAMNALDFKRATAEAVRGAVQFLQKRGGKVGLTGFCMGGAVTVIGAATIPELSAAVCFYGLPPENVASGKDVKVPLQALRFSPDGGGQSQHAHGGGTQSARNTHVWVLTDGGTLRKVDVVRGLDDGNVVEIVGGDLHPGDRVVIDENTHSAQATPASGPRMPRHL